MRKLTAKQKAFLKIHAARLHKRAIDWRKWRRIRNGLRARSSAQDVVVEGQGRKIRTRAVERRPMPEIFCLDRNPEESLALLAQLRDTILTRATEVAERKRNGHPPLRAPLRYYDFSTMRYVSPTAALVLAAFYNRMKFIAGHKLHTVDEYKWAPQVRQTLQAVGFHEFLEMKRPTGIPLPTTGIQIQKFTTGSEAEGAPLGVLQDALANLLPNDLAEKLLDAEPYAGMIEAILNSHSWAYPTDHGWDFAPMPNWWLTGAVDRAAGRVTVVVFDQGVSIPVSLPRWKHWGKFEERAKRILAKLRITAAVDDPLNDGWAIRLAMTIAKTQTDLPQHGKGLHTMVEVAQRARHGRLRIISRNGEYVWETGKKPKIGAYGNPIGGTLVEWTLDL